jgi:hypothetical protein
MPQTLPLADPQLADAAAALAEWRSTLPRTSRIPEELWSRATELAERHGVAKVAAALKLDYTSLKRRLSVTASRPAEGERTSPQSPAFVELELGFAAGHARLRSGPL